MTDTATLERLLEDVPDRYLEAMARAADREEAAHMGEPSPWEGGDLDPDWIDGRRAAMRCALTALISEASKP